MEIAKEVSSIDKGNPRSTATRTCTASNPSNVLWKPSFHSTHQPAEVCDTPITFLQQITPYLLRSILQRGQDGILEVPIRRPHTAALRVVEARSGERALAKRAEMCHPLCSAVGDVRVMLLHKLQVLNPERNGLRMTQES